MQLSLPFYARGSLREAIESYIRERAEYVAEATITDYQERARWVYEAFGELLPLVDLNYDTLRAVEREWGPRGKGLMLCTVKKRLVFVLAAMKLAAARGIIRLDQVPPMPKIATDSRRRERCVTLGEYQQLRLALSGRMRTLVDLAFWTGQHRYDLWSMQRCHLDPDYRWTDDAGEVKWTGAFWRRNHKNKRCRPCWLPAEAEFVPTMREILAEPGPRDGLIVGRVCSYARSLYAATDRIEIQPVSLMAMRHSLATLLMERTGNYEYCRLVLGHEGELVATPDRRYAGTGNPSTISRYYLHPSSATVISAMTRRQEEIG
jgi:hypothetical protein